MPKIHTLNEAKAFGGWLRRLAISVWLLHLRKKDALRGADEFGEYDRAQNESPSVGVDLDRALARLPKTVRLCVILSYHVGMTHAEIAETLKTPLGTVKSHINRGTRKLKQMLSAYNNQQEVEKES